MFEPAARVRLLPRAGRRFFGGCWQAHAEPARHSVQRDERFANLERLHVTLQSSGYVAKAAAAPAHIAHSVVSGRELALERRVAVRFARETVEVIQSILDQSLPHFRRAGQSP